jgi:hypothetical protein
MRIELSDRINNALFDVMPDRVKDLMCGPELIPFLTRRKTIMDSLAIHAMEKDLCKYFQYRLF